MVYIHAWASHCIFVVKDLAVKNAVFIRCYKDIFIFYDIVSILHTYNSYVIIHLGSTHGITVERQPWINM